MIVSALCSSGGIKDELPGYILERGVKKIFLLRLPYLRRYSSFLFFLISKICYFLKNIIHMKSLYNR